MNVSTMATLTSLAALAVLMFALAGAGVLTAQACGARWSDHVRELLTRPARWLAVAIPAGATAGSLWFSEVAGFVPCELCWYQRIAMYPLAVVTLVGVLRRDRHLLFYVAPIAGVGFAISLWHWLIERVPSLTATSSCSVTAPCTVPWFTEFGFVTLAFMAAAGFAGTVVAVALSRTRSTS